MKNFGFIRIMASILAYNAPPKLEIQPSIIEDNYNPFPGSNKIRRGVKKNKKTKSALQRRYTKIRMQKHSRRNNRKAA